MRGLRPPEALQRLTRYKSRACCATPFAQFLAGNAADMMVVIVAAALGMQPMQQQRDCLPQKIRAAPVEVQQTPCLSGPEVLVAQDDR